VGSNPSTPAILAGAAGAKGRLLHESMREGGKAVARVNPGEFLRQVRAESAKIVWPSRRETLMTGMMVVIMTTLLAFFFFGVDNAFSAIVQALLGLLS
jgi:preprotein translocase subunit SecE